MYLRQFYLGCLAHASYLIGANGEAAVIDPQRDVDFYIRDAAEQGFAIRHVIETHLHADFISGHRELAARTGARVYFGYRAPVKFEYVPAHEGDEIVLGSVRLRFLETPGHTPESVSVLVFDGETGAVPDSVFTGDTLFVGDVGRPDLLGSRVPAAELAGLLYDSLHEKLLALPDQVKVYPAHGAGSMCGRNISKERNSTIGNERRFNYALQPMERDEFIRLVTCDLPEAPSYFSRDARINLEGPTLLNELPVPCALSVAETVEALDRGGLVLDTRPAENFGLGHIPGSLHIGLGGQFASWAGSLIPPDASIVLVAEDHQQVAEAQVRLARVGLDRIEGYLADGIDSWRGSGCPLVETKQVSVQDLQNQLRDNVWDVLLDVRKLTEFQGGHIETAVHVPLTQLAQNLGSFNPESRIAVICGSGYRSAIAASILEQHGCLRISNVVGGMSAWNGASLPIVG